MMSKREFDLLIAVANSVHVLLLAVPASSRVVDARHDLTSAVDAAEKEREGRS